EDAAEHAIMRFEAVFAEFQRRIEAQRLRPVEGLERAALAQSLDVLCGRPENVETRGHAMLCRVDHLGRFGDVQADDNVELDRKSVEVAERLRYGPRLARIQGLAKDDELAFLLGGRNQFGDLRRQSLAGLSRRARNGASKDRGAERERRPRESHPARNDEGLLTT